MSSIPAMIGDWMSRLGISTAQQEDYLGNKVRNLTATEVEMAQRMNISPAEYGRRAYAGLVCSRNGRLTFSPAYAGGNRAGLSSSLSLDSVRAQERMAAHAFNNSFSDHVAARYATTVPPVCDVPSVPLDETFAEFLERRHGVVR